jgi:hypothetical protein
MKTELTIAQQHLRYAAMNKLLPGLITAHLVDVPRKKSIEITAYLDVDSKIMRCDAAIDYEDLEEFDDLTGLVVKIIDLHLKDYKEKNK